jgi:hypothetical protein
MAYKSTGKPVGRPKSAQEYETFSFKAPKALMEEVKRYAKQRQRPVGELIRDGLIWRIGEGDPRGLGRVQFGESDEKEYYGNTEIEQMAREEGASALTLQEVCALLVRQEARIGALTQALENQTVLLRNGMYSSNTEKATAGEGDGSGKVQDSFDATKYKLGRLCKGGHEFGSTGMTLLTLNGSHCPPCRAAQERERQRQRRENGLGRRRATRQV